MKEKLTITLFTVVLLYANCSLGQAVEEVFSDFKSGLSEVMVKDSPFKQSIDNHSESCIYELSINDVGDGSITTYLFNAADINPYKIEFEARRRNVYVFAETRGARDLIKVFENGEVDGYDNEMEFLAKDVENARALVEAFKKLAEKSAELEEQKEFVLGPQPTLNAALAYLKQNVKPVEVNETFLDQKFKANSAYSALVDIERENKTDEEALKYHFNFADINAHSIDFNTHRAFVFVEGLTTGDKDLIEIFENGEKSHYDNEFRIYVPEIEVARALKSVLRYYAEASAELPDKALEYVANMHTMEQSTTHLKSNVIGVINGEDNYRQSFEAVEANPYLIKFTREYVNDGQLDEYIFNLSDLNAHSVQFETRRNEVKVVFNTKDNKDMIMHKNNGELDRYENGIAILANDIQKARVIVSALKLAITKAGESYTPEFSKSYSGASMPAVFSFIKSNMQKVVIGDDAYDQEIEMDDENRCILNYKVEDLSKGEVLIHRFNLIDINGYEVYFETRGEEVYVHLETKDNKDLIEVIEDGETDGFDNELNIRAIDIETARNLQLAFEAISKLCENQ